MQIHPAAKSDAGMKRDNFDFTGKDEDGKKGSIILRALGQQKQGADLGAAAKKLIDTANANGGVDNVTVNLAQYQPN